MPADRPTIALAGVRAARQELHRAGGLLRRAIRLAASEGIPSERLANAAGTSLQELRRLAGRRHVPDGRGADPIEAVIACELPRPFLLCREEDVTGVSGTGPVAWGVEFSDGRAVLLWRGDTTGIRQFAVFESIEDVETIHGHLGKTRVAWVLPSEIVP